MKTHIGVQQYHFKLMAYGLLPWMSCVRPGQTFPASLAKRLPGYRKLKSALNGSDIIIYLRRYSGCSCKGIITSKSSSITHWDTEIFPGKTMNTTFPMIQLIRTVWKYVSQIMNCFTRKFWIAWSMQNVTTEKLQVFYFWFLFFTKF